MIGSYPEDDGKRALARLKLVSICSFSYPRGESEGGGGHVVGIYTPNPLLEGSKIDQKAAQNEALKRCPKGAPKGVQKCSLLTPRAAPKRIP